MSRPRAILVPIALLVLAATHAGGQAFPPVVELADLDGVDGFTLVGVNGNDWSGISVAGLGDIDGDGVDDLAIGARRADPDGLTDAGEVYVVFGRASGFPARLDLAELDGSNGFVVEGASELDEAGFSVGAAGDFDGDGLADLLIGAPKGNPADEEDAGIAYVVYGSDGGFPARLSLAGLPAEDGFALRGGAAGDQAGFSVAGAGDFDGDGLDDLLIGAPHADPDGKEDVGEAYVVFGTAAPPRVVDLGALDGSDGVVLTGLSRLDLTGISVAGTGDVDADGRSDVVVGARAADTGGNTDAGAAYVVLGRPRPLPATIDLANLDGDDGFRIEGAAAFDNAGLGVGGGGDFDADGFDDVLVGARLADPDDRRDAGATYVIRGGERPFPAVVRLRTLAPGAGSEIRGIAVDDLSGRALAAVGDINVDGVDDLMIGAWAADPGGRIDAGQAYGVFGDAAGLPAVIELADLDGSDGFRMNGVDSVDNAGFSVAGAGDVDHDGFEDLLVGALLADGDAGELKLGETYVVFGVLNTAPVVVITAPADGAAFTVEDSIAFSGTAEDTQDGMITTDLEWSTDLDGAIGSGGSFQASLSHGLHTVTAAATDSQGVTGSAAIELVVTSDTCPAELVVSDRTVSGDESFEAVERVTVGPAFRVEAGGRAALRAGRGLVVTSDTTVALGGRLEATVTPDPCDPPPAGRS